MPFNVVKFYSDYHIPVVSSGKHYRPGWVNINCPFCGGNDGHLGVNIKRGTVKCWRCGSHGMVSIIRTLLSCSWERAEEIHEQYGAKTGRRGQSAEPEDAPRASKTVCDWPFGTGVMTDTHRNYLRGRGYNAELLEKVWGLKGTSNLGDYKFRVMVPIVYAGRMVSYQGRDVTGLSDLKYKACKKVDEVIDHQNIVYGMDLAKGRSCILVEGVADVWRLGPGAVCCFGVAFTMSQVNLLAEKFRTVYIMFDGGETEAAKQARKLALLLSARGVDVELLFLDEGDPGEMPQQEADELMAELLLEGYSLYQEVV